MRPGRLDQRVTILRRELGTSSSGSGLSIEEWTQVTRVWAEVRPVRGGERFTGVERLAEVTHAFRIRYREAFEASWRLEWRGRHFDVIEVLPGGQRLREYLDVLAVASEAINPAS